jgi:hypothetical protein
MASNCIVVTDEEGSRRVDALTAYGARAAFDALVRTFSNAGFEPSVEEITSPGRVVQMTARVVVTIDDSKIGVDLYQHGRAEFSSEIVNDPCYKYAANMAAQISTTIAVWRVAILGGGDLVREFFPSSSDLARPPTEADLAVAKRDAGRYARNLLRAMEMAGGRPDRIAAVAREFERRI